MVNKNNTDDVHIAEMRPLLSPAILMVELPLNEHAAAMIKKTRPDIGRIFIGQDDRLLVV